MNTRYLLHFFLVTCMLCAHGASMALQPFDSPEKSMPVDVSDTTAVRLSYENGLKKNITSIAYWDSQLLAARNHGMPLYECKTRTRLANLYSAQGNIRKTIANYTLGLQIAERNGFKSEMLELIKNLEVSYAMQLDRRRSLYFSYKGLKLAEKLNDEKAIVDFYASIAVHHSTSGNINKALEMHHQCLKKCRELNYENGIAGALLDIGSAYANIEHYDEVIPYYLESLKYANLVTEPGYAVQIYSSATEAYRFKKKYDSAFYYARIAYRIADSVNNKRALASTLTILSRMEYEIGEYRLAKKHAIKALGLAQSSRFNAQLPTIYPLLKNIYLREGRYKEALENYELYVNIRDSSSNEKVRKQALEKQFEYNFEKKENAYRLLQQQNQIQNLQLRQNQYLFFGLGVSLLVLFMIAYLFMRQNRFRTEHQRVKLEQKLLRAQMNPHFVFNSLNSIQHFIMKGQNSQAESYLWKFSKLIRDLLESNIKENLTISEEVNMLNAYLEMESLRFGSTFSYSISIDDQIDQRANHVPHLMIQPFVENAIWHGLLPKTDNKVLRICFEYHTEKTIKCIVDDNGVGREASMKKENTFRKKSLALSFVNQRMELIGKTHKIEGSTQIIDKKDENNNSTGTTVVIVLPILKP